MGVKITNEELCFKEQIGESINEARTMANVTYSVPEISFNRLLIGKTFWKGLVLQSVLHASEIIQYTEEDLDKFQSIGDMVYTALLRVPGYTATEALRGEIGASSSKIRSIKSKFFFVNIILIDNIDDLIKEIFLLNFKRAKTNGSTA